MKTKLTLLALLITAFSFAQNGINYKAVIKDNLGNVVANQSVNIRFTILKGVVNVYQETHLPMTDANGIAIVNIGEGTTVSGSFSNIAWELSTHSLKVEIDIAGGTTFVPMGTTEFKYVPYALLAKDVKNTIWKRTLETDNISYNFGNVGIGSTTPTALLEINDFENADLKIVVPSISASSKLELRNGNEAGTHSFYRIENRSDKLRFDLDSDLSSMVVGYEEKMSLTTSGLALQNGNRINEFSIDGTLSGNSNLAVPTEKAVKTYVDNNNSSNYWKKGNLNSAGSITATNTYQPIGPTLVINKEFADSRVEATVNSQMYGGNFSSAFAVIFQIRINGSNTTFENTAVIDRTNTLDFLSIHAVFMGLPAGFHTIQIYARSAGSGTSTSVQIDPTGYGGAMIVKETF